MLQAILSFAAIEQHVAGAMQTEGKSRAWVPLGATFRAELANLNRLKATASALPRAAGSSSAAQQNARNQCAVMLSKRNGMLGDVLMPTQNLYRRASAAVCTSTAEVLLLPLRQPFL